MYHFPVIEIARYLGIRSPSVSNMIITGEHTVKADDDVVNY
jgi:hypothetical protein